MAFELFSLVVVPVEAGAVAVQVPAQARGLAEDTETALRTETFYPSNTPEVSVNEPLL
jgi:hypothetical protein